jgi:hypothetical protein
LPEEKDLKMKRASFVAFCAVILFSVCLLVNATAVKAAYPGYSHMVYPLTNAVTIDGNWTSADEWTDGLQTNITANSVFRTKWELITTPEFRVNQYILIEILNDTTDDADDYWQICMDCDMSGGTAPGSGDLRIDIVGHTDVTWYQGDGTGWTPMATPSEDQFRWNNSISESPISSTPHWILELMFNKALGPGPQYWARIAVYDASNPDAGVHAWPPTSRDVPDDYGDFPYSSEPIPENLNFGVVVLLSSVAVLVGSYYMRKRPKNTKQPQIKL